RNQTLHRSNESSAWVIAPSTAQRSALRRRSPPMSDHIDGPRQIGDPSADLTDLFAFTSPENPARTVLAADVFPTCGQEAIFSNAVTYAIVVRRAKVASLGDNARFETCD